MSVVTKDYVESLPEIYRDILSAFPKIEPARKAGWGLAYQTLGENLGASHSLGEILEACQNMERAGAVEIKHRILVCPTELGEQIITLLTGKKAGEFHVPEFPSPTQA